MSWTLDQIENPSGHGLRLGFVRRIFGKAERAKDCVAKVLHGYVATGVWALAPLLVLASALPSARAATVPTALNDLILGFRATGGQGSSSNLEVNLGSISQYYSATATITVTQLSATDLATVYGSTWASRLGTDLFWGVIGTTGRTSGGPNGQPSRTLWASAVQTSSGGSSPWPRNAGSAQSSASALIEALYTGSPGSLDVATATANSASTAVINASTIGSWTSQAGTSGAAFGIFNPATLFDKPGAGSNYFKTDLYEMRSSTTGGNGTLLGTFTLSSSGVLTFSASAIAPAITTQPVTQTVTAGSSATFSVVASGSPTPSYQWATGGTNISGATNATYSIASSQSSDAGSYSVTVTNSAGSVTSNAVSLTVNFSPAITTQPVAQTVTAGSSVTFTVAASANPAPTYQWNKAGSPISAATNANYAIASAQSSDAGNYTVTVTNSIGSVTSNSAALIVNSAPAITTQPLAQIATAGATVTLNVVAAGTPLPTYQWSRNGSGIPGATSASYVLASAQPGDAGNYSVSVTNSVGTVTSTTVALTVNTAPAISTQPVAQTVVVGTAVTFAVVASGIPTPTYQWRRNGTPIGGATAASYVIASAQSGDAGNYTVAVTNSVASITSNAATLVVNPLNAPTISVQPAASQVVAVGAAVSFTVIGAGVPAPTYQWSRNGSPLGGATGATYTIGNAQAGDAGNYAVVLTNSSGSITSSIAVLSFTSAPVISTQPIETTVVAGGTATFTVVATGTPTPAYQWFKDGAAISGATNSFLNLAAVQNTAAGSYSVTVTNALGSVTSSAVALVVTGAPAITTQPVSQTVVAGTNATFVVSATGSPAPTYQWNKNGTAISGATGATHSIVVVQGADAGNYTVTVTNSVGSLTSANAILTVNAAPTVTSQPVAQTVAAGAPAVFAVVATAIPAPTYQWKKGSAPISGATAATFTIASAQPADAGTYSVQVTNSIAVVTSTAVALTVQTAPAITTQPAAQAVTIGGNTSFAVVATGNPAPTYQWNRNGVGLLGATLATYAITGAQTADEGNYTVTVSNAVGTVTSSVAALTVTNSPTINIPPAAQYVLLGAAATFTVSAIGAPAPSYQWHKEGTAIAGATNASVTISATQASDAGNYTVSVTNSVGTVTSAPAALTFAVPPTITAQPESVFVTVGGATKFVAVATGSPVPTYQWNKAGVAIAGATGATLEILKCQLADVGDYSVTVSNDIGAVTSTSAKLTLIGAPVIVTQPVNVVASLGTAASFTVLVTGDPAPNFQWFRNGLAIFGAGRATLAIAAVQETDVGNYWVSVVNSGGLLLSATATLTLPRAPIITTQPVSQVAFAGSSATFSVVASGAPAPTFQWNKDGTPLSGATNNSYTVSAAQAADVGSYTVSVTNLSGSVTSNPATLALPVAPAFTTQPAGRAVIVGSSVTFDAVASGAPAPTYQWKKSGGAIAGATNAEFTIVATQASDAGDYTVTATNALGSVTSPAASLVFLAAPVITTSPVGKSLLVGAPASLTVVATGQPAPSYLWKKDGSIVAGARNAVLNIERVQTTDTGSYSVTVSNILGAVTSEPVRLTVDFSGRFGAYFFSFGAGRGDGALFVRVDNTATFVGYLAHRRSAIVVDLKINADGTFVATGSEARAQAASGATAPSEVSVDGPVRARAESGAFDLSGRIADGTLSGQLAGLDTVFVGAIDASTGPAQSFAGYNTASALDASAGKIYAIVGASGKALILAVTPAVVDGSVATVSANGQLSVATLEGNQFSAQLNVQTKALSVSLAPAGGGVPVAFSGLAPGAVATGRLLNLSTRGFIPVGGSMTSGFVMKGTGTKQLVVRVAGPALGQFPGISTPLADPRLDLIYIWENAIVAISNDNWESTAANAAVMASLGAFPLQPNSKDSVLVPALPNLPTGYTVRASASGATGPGVALAEIYDADPAGSPVRLVNVSTLGFVGTGEQALVPGFVIEGNAPRQVLIRAVGPGLSQFAGQSNVLVDPQLQVISSGQASRVVANNNDWGGTASLKAAFAQVGAFALTDNSKDSAVVVALQPGAYTVVVSGASNGTGTALVEIYDMSP